MGLPAARVSDMHVCPMWSGVVPHVGGPVLPPGAVTVMTGGLPQARVGDQCVCAGGPDVIAKGSLGVFAGGMPCARISDMTVHGGNIVMGMPTVLIGDIGGAGGGGGGGSMLMALNSAAAFGEPGPQAQAMVGANQTGSYFVRRCT